MSWLDFLFHPSDMNDVTCTFNNAEISNDGGEESIAFLGKTQLAATSLCSLPSSIASRMRRQRKQTNCHHISMVPKKHGKLAQIN